MSSRTKRIVVLAAALSLLVAACGSASDKAAEQLAEELIEASSDGDVSVDISGDGDDATINVETEEGSISIGTGAEMPEGLEIPVPDGGDVMMAFSADDAVNVSLSYDQGRYDEIVVFYEDWTGSTGDEWESQTMTTGSGEDTMRSNMWAQSDGNSMIAIADCTSMESETTDLDAVCVTIAQGQ